ncbi:SulP family inorganic anion transporter [Roseicitreum antarcticum]|uniref:Sulfate permease, SulP family n=1 Tax=Roseicitreum antarcticum TaxID=564137 RepID=A0A1H2VMW2_9RHOB|nr:SulP family inorganic anion transporter [Roseicitreum antarcticum]SDW69651.1 sulfate permease, SulP family [Roseicitreum antarcticum]
MPRNTPPEPARPPDDSLLIPALILALREGYGAARLRADAIAALTVAIVALPLSMAIAIAAGGTPEMGLYTAIFGGFFVSLLGGSRHQIGGPAGAFIVLMATTVALHGIDGLILATAMSGVMLAGLGVLRLGSYIKFVPYPVTVGFTAGIAVIIFASQIKEILGLTLGAPEPGPLLEKLPVIWASLPTLNPATLALSAGTVAIIVVLKRLAPAVPGLLVAVIAITLAAMLGDLPVATIGSVFGELPSHLPLPGLPEISLEKLGAVLPSAIAFTLLGAIESLLSAIVADGMTGRRHNSNMELVAQGAANMASALFGGMAVTGTIARTATNVRAGGITPVAGMLHAGFILCFLLVAAPLASFIPLAALAGVLAVVAWNMIEREAIRALLRASRGDAAVLLVTFFLTIFRDLTEAIVVGFALGSVLFIHRMSSAIEVRAHTSTPPENDGDANGLAVEHDIVVYQIRGAFFFGSVASISSVLDRIAAQNRGLILDFSEVIFTDSSAANLIEGMVHKARKNGVAVVLACTDHATRVQLFAQGIKPPLVQYQPSVDLAKQALRRRIAQ